MATQALDWASEPDESAGTSDDREMGHLVLMKDSATTFPLFPGANVVGRLSEETPKGSEEGLCTEIGSKSWKGLYLDDSSISARHAVIFVEGSSADLFVKDLNSLNKTYLSRKGKFKPLTSDRYAIDSGDTLRFGAVECQVVMDPGLEEISEPHGGWLRQAGMQAVDRRGGAQLNEYEPTQIWGQGDAAADVAEPLPPVQAGSSMPAAASPEQVMHSSQPDASASTSRQSLASRRDSGKENTPMSRPDLRISTLHSSQSPFSEVNTEQDQPASRNHFPIPIPSAPAISSYDRGMLGSPPLLRGHISLKDWAGHGLQPSSSLQSMQSLGDSLPSLGDWASLDATAKYRDLHRDSPDFAFGSNGSSPSGSSPQSFGRYMAIRSKSSRGNSIQAQQTHGDADFSFSSKQAGQPFLHGIAEDSAVSYGSPDSDSQQMLRSLQNISAISDDQDGASSLLMLHDQNSPKAEQVTRPRSPSIKRTRGSEIEDSSGSKSPRRSHVL